MDGYVHMIKEVLGRQHRKKSAARYSFAECQYSRLLKVTRLVSTSPENFSLQVNQTYFHTSDARESVQSNVQHSTANLSDKRVCKSRFVCKEQ